MSTIETIGKIQFTIELDDEFVNTDEKKKQITLLSPATYRSFCCLRVNGLMVFADKKLCANLSQYKSKEVTFPIDGEEVVVKMDKT
jgi:hypothetical protein